MKLSTCLLVGIGLLVSSQLSAQTKEIKSATISSFDDPYDLMVITKEDIGEMSLTLDSGVVIKGKKKKEIKASDLQEGNEVTISYEVRDKKRVITGIELLSDMEDGKKKFTGLFEGYDGTTAFIDGRRVQLAKKSTFKGAKKGEGKMDIDFMGFDDDLLKKGCYMNVKGVMQPDGVILADEIIVRKNTTTKDDAELIGLVNQGFNPNGLRQQQVVPLGTFNAPNGLYNGNIMVGDVTYKLVDDIKLQGYINEVGYKLIPEYTQDPNWQKENQKIDFRFYVIDDAVPNAYAWPNGMVFIHTGLLKIIENEAQLAFVLSHEISHVLYEHGSARYKKSEQIKDAMGWGKKLTGLVNIGKKKRSGVSAEGYNYEYYAMMQKLNGLGGTGAGDASKSAPNQMLSVALNTVGAQITPDALSGLFGKEQENQADRVGLFYAQQAGYDIREIPKFWNKMMDKNNDPTFLGNIANGFKSLLKSTEAEIDINTDMKTQLLNSSAEMIVNNVFKSVYASHPLSQNRLKTANLLLTTTYQNKDYSTVKIGAEEYKGYVSKLK